MKANPGGELALDEVIGRDDLIRRLWDTLAQQSVVLIAERRMGKTSVIKKMAAECPDERVTLYRDVEGLDTPHAFVEEADDLGSLLRLFERDHYVRRDAKTGAYRFRFGLIKRWWRLSRDLVA